MDADVFGGGFADGCRFLFVSFYTSFSATSYTMHYSINLLTTTIPQYNHNSNSKVSRNLQMPRPVLTMSTSAINNDAFMLLGNKVMTEEMNHTKKM